MGAVIGIFSAKGGVGKTLLATNLAVALGLGYHRKTILLDLSIGNGTADLLLDLTPERSWLDLKTVFYELTPRHIALIVSEYCPDVDLLASPSKISGTEIIKMEELSLLLDTLKMEYDLIVLDTGSGFDTLVSGVLTLADFRLLVLTPDAPSLRSNSRFLPALPNPQRKTGLIINQYSAGAAITPNEIKEHLGQPILAVLPIDQAGVWTNICFGKPCVLRKSSKLGRSIRQLSVNLLRLIDAGDNKETNDD